MNRGGTLGSRHCHCMLQLPAFTQRLSKFYFLPTVSEPLQWTQPEWPASHKKPFRGKLNDLETRPSKAFLSAPENSGSLAAASPDGRVDQAERRRGFEESQRPCAALPCFSSTALRWGIIFANKKSWLRNLFKISCIWFFLQQNKITTNSSVDTVFRSFLILFYKNFMIQLLMEHLAGCHLDIIVYKAEDFSSRPFSRHLCLLNNSRFFHGWKSSGCTQAWGKPTSKPTQIWNW